MWAQDLLAQFQTTLRYEHQYPLTASTIMHATKKPITYWFKAMWWFTKRKSGVSAVNLQELLGRWQLSQRG
jgi:hypothetical protein